LGTLSKAGPAVVSPKLSPELDSVVLFVGVPGGTKASPRVYRCASSSASSSFAAAGAASDVRIPKTSSVSNLGLASSGGSSIRIPIPTFSAAEKSTSQRMPASSGSRSGPTSGSGSSSNAGPTGSCLAIGEPTSSSTRWRPW
jgi:hypothetical protein